MLCAFFILKRLVGDLFRAAVPGGPVEAQLCFDHPRIGGDERGLGAQGTQPKRKAAEVVIRGDGIPDRAYRIQYAYPPQSTNWQTLGTATADQFGIFELTDATDTPQRYYRSVYP